MKRISRKGGFTLVELIVVIAIILILASVLVPNIFKYISKAAKANCVETRRSLAMEMLADYVLSGNMPQEAGQVDIPDAMKKRYKCPSRGTFTAYYENGNINISCNVHDEGEEAGGSRYTPVKVADSAQQYEKPLNAVIKTLYDSVVAERLKDNEKHIACVLFKNGKVSQIYYYSDENDKKSAGQKMIDISQEEKENLDNKISEALKDTNYKIITNRGAERIFFDWNGNTISACDQNAKPIVIAGQGASSCLSLINTSDKSDSKTLTNKTGTWE